MTDYNIRITVRNGRLLRRVRETFGSAAELCRVAGVTQQQVSALMTMRESPFLQDGSLSVAAAKVCSALGAYPEDLWPEHMRVARRRSSAEIDMSAAEVEQIATAGPERAFLQSELLQRWIATLSERDRYVIEQRLDGATTFDEIASDMGVTRERVRQIELRGLRRLRQAARRDRVECYADCEL